MVKKITVSKRFMIITYEDGAYIIDAKYYDMIVEAINTVKQHPEMIITLRPEIRAIEVEEELEEETETEEELE